MCGITGWIHWQKDLTQCPSIIEQMTQTLTHRGPDAAGTWSSTSCMLGHRRLRVIDPEWGAQPLCRRRGGETYVLVYNGEIYNAQELRSQLISHGETFYTACDTEVLLCAYMYWGHACVEKLNGIFAFAVWRVQEQSLFVCRDRLGVKPLFYCTTESSFIFGSEPKAILAHPEYECAVQADGLAEIIALGPARTPGHGIYKHMSELKPGHWLYFDRLGMRMKCYWKLESHEHIDDLSTTVQTIHQLLSESLERQLVSDVPLCTLLSGGLDSSLLTTLAAKSYKEQDKGALATFSLDFVENDVYFQADTYQPNADQPWVDRVVQFLRTNHRTVEIDLNHLVNSLITSVQARDTPGMADIDGSLYLFCQEIKKTATVAISGEAADEIFGGYPWFHQTEVTSPSTFPWSTKLEQRIQLLQPEIIDWIKPSDHVNNCYDQALAEVPHLHGETDPQKRMRTLSYLNITRFMPTLLDRKDRMSMAVGLEVRVPFCDHRLIEYVWNIPWEMKNMRGREKGILREAFKGMLPADVLERKKSPYPKTHHPAYLQAVSNWLLEILHEPSSPLLQIFNKQAIIRLMQSPAEMADLRWFGQLMTAPQLFAYLIQINEWLRLYQPSMR